jgi:pyruvate, water dikinase
VRGREKYLFELGMRAAGSSNRSGGKAAGLSRLIQGGFPVPPGFFLSADLFRFLFKASGLSLPEKSDPAAQIKLETLRRVVLSWQLPSPTESRLLEAFETLSAPVAVRSSLIGEDDPCSSFAGQLDSFLNITDPAELVESVKRCWASFFSPHAWAYRAHIAPPPSRGARPRINGMAVIIQRMVFAKVSGIAFSTDPVSGDPHIIIEADEMAQGATRGRKSPDRYILDSRLERQTFTFTGEGKPALPRRQVLGLAKLVRDIARRERRPQDVEWAWDGHDIFILQARPVTGRCRSPVYSRRLVSDMAPGLIKPLVWSTKTCSMAQNVIGKMFTQILRSGETDFTFLVKPIHSRIYTDITRLGDFLRSMGLPPNFFEMMARDEKPAIRFQIRFAMGRPVLRLIAFLIRNSRMTGKTALFILLQNRKLREFCSRDWTKASFDALSEAVERILNLHAQAQWFVFLVLMNLSLRRKTLEYLTKNHFTRIEFDALLKPAASSHAFAPRSQLQALSAEVEGFLDGGLNSLKEKTHEEILRVLSRSDEGRRLSRKIDVFIDRFGYISPDGSDFTRPTWKENPDLIWKFMLHLRAHPKSRGGSTASSIEETRLRLVGRIPLWLRPFFRSLMHSVLTHQELRERTSMIMSRESALMRDLFLNIGEHLKKKSIVEQAEDVFFLHYSELRAIQDGTTDPGRTGRLVRERRARIQRDAGIDPPEIIDSRLHGKEEAVFVCGEYLSGIPGSAGMARGFARIIRDPSHIHWQPTRDDILVVPFTDVGWIPLLHGMGGIVAESGGQLSHTSIIAREYGIPAVVNVPGALQIIKDGQPITLDGTGGRVYLQDIPPGKEKTT